ncbi:MAG: hypothetical protein FWB75_02980, partial [Oscillospiraceae bacterium]|nr:hypothetical protein [Oscillospiraceae bacterium]
MKRKNIKKHTKHQIKMLLIAVLLISVLPAISAADFAAGAEEQLGGSQSVTVSGTEQGWVVEFVLAGPGLYAQTGQSEILLHSVAIAQGQGFNAADHGGQFPSNETVREESRYDLWPNSFGYGFNEWSFNGQWQTKDPLTGGAYTLDLEDFSLQQPTENQPLRIYTHFQQLLITCDATLREAVGRTLAGVPARLVLQNSFEAQVPQPVEIPYGHEITIDSVDENDNTYLNHLGARHFYVPGETVLRLESITLRGAALSDGNPEVFVNGGIEVYGGTLYINPGAAIVYNRGEYGGGVSVYDGHVVMSGGLIHGNHSSSGGGGARVERGSFTISGGYITENTTGDEERLGWSWTDDYINGGGVFVTGGDFVMHSGVIRGNAAWGYRFSNGLGSTGGGGVAVSRGCFTMYGGEISGNYTDGAGGGVGLRLGNAVMHAGDISGNTAKSEGGGLYLFCGDFTMYDGHIGQNKVSQGRSQDYGGGGGGVHVTWGDFIMHGGIISENTAFSWGGGVYVFGFAPESLRGENQWVSGGNVIMNGGTITRNSTGADSVGGGIYVRRGTFTMHDGLISENKAGEQGGGGVFVYGDAEVQDIWVVGDEGGWEAVGEEFRSIGEVTLHGGTIRDNETSGPGGGVFAFGSNMTMHSGIISGNSSGPFGGGGVFIRSDKLVLGRFDNETWETFEEEIHYGGAFVMYGGSISNNRTVGPGGGVHSFSGDFTMHGGGISGNMSGLFGGGGVFVHASSKGWLVRNLHWADAEGTWSEVASQWIYIQNEDPQLEGVWVPFALWVLHNAENTEIKPDLRQGGSFTMTGGLINGNQTLGAPTGGGGGVGVLNGTFAVSGDSVISNNTAAGRNGGGLHLSFAEAVVDGGVSILGNQAVNGGGAYVGTNALLSMSGGEMAGNRAQLDGGGIFAQEHTYIYPMLPEEGMPHYPGLDIGSKVVFDG